MKRMLALTTGLIFGLSTLHLSAAPQQVQGTQTQQQSHTAYNPSYDPCCGGRVAAGIIAALVLGGGALSVLLHSSSSAHAHIPFNNSGHSHSS